MSGLSRLSQAPTNLSVHSLLTPRRVDKGDCPLPFTTDPALKAVFNMQGNELAVTLKKH